MKEFILIMIRVTCVLNTLHHVLLYLAFFLTSFLLLPVALVLKNHRLIVSYLRFWLRLYFGYNGVIVSLDSRVFASESSGIIITNRDDTVDPLLLTMHAPYESVLVVSPRELYMEDNTTRFENCPLNLILDTVLRWFAGFPKKRMQVLTYLFGFLPEEAFTIFDYKSKTFVIEQYYDSEFAVIQPIYSNRSVERDPIPFAAMLAAKKGMPIELVQITHSRPSYESSLLCLNRVRIHLFDTVPWQADTAAMMQDYKVRMRAMLESGNMR